MNKKWTTDPLLLGQGAYGVVVFPGPKNINNEGRSINYLNRPAKIMTSKSNFNKSVNNAKTIKRISNIKYNFQPYKRQFTKKNLPNNIRNMNIFEWINNDDKIYLAHMPYLGESIFKIKNSPTLKNKILQIPVSVYMREILKLFRTIKDFNDKGYTHGDLHYGNILIHPNTGEIHIIDFDMFGSSNNSPEYDLGFRLQHALRTLFTDILNTPQYQEFGQFILEDIIPKMKSDSIQEIIDSIQTFIDKHSTYTSLNLMYLRPKGGGSRLRKSKRKTQKGGKAGHLYRIINLNDNAQILGAGSNGLIASNKDITVKLFYNREDSWRSQLSGPERGSVEDCKQVQKEADIQIAARKLLKDIVTVPEVHEVFNQQILYKGQKYLCGISMDRVPLVDSFDYAVHILLGYKQDDTDSIWTRDYRNPPSEENPPRGFFAGVEMMEAIWQDEDSSLTIESVAYTMGLALATLIKGGIIPYDLEWIYGGDGKIYLIDFGFCEFGNVDSIRYLNHIGSWGLGGDYYIPHNGHRGYEEFMKGYSGYKL